MSTKSAALTYTVPKSTLGDRVSGRVLHGTKSGSPSICPLMKTKKLVRCHLSGAVHSRVSSQELKRGVDVNTRNSIY